MVFRQEILEESPTEILQKIEMKDAVFEFFFMKFL